MRVIGVVDLRGGRAVHARGGIRERYVPVRAVAGVPVDGNPLALGQAYVERLGITEIYVADLDAIERRPAQDASIEVLSALGAAIWLDAGVTSPEGARHALAVGATHVVIGLETLASYGALREICAAGGPPIAFSLDLRHGEPIAVSPGITAGEPPPIAAARAVDAGAGSVIVIDLARVGTGAGPDLATIAAVRRAVPATTLLAGGGVRGMDDLARLADAGCDGVLVASALQVEPGAGGLGAADVAACRGLGYGTASR
jgi:phosphoribosylformimino-5-aminoimidazole carboxamide ribotide isomerase